MIDFARPLGDAAIEASRRVLRAARSPLATEVLFGYADDGDGASRAKLWLQLRPGARAAALDLASAMLGRPLGAELADAGELHLVGLDLGAHGLAGAKLYFSHPPTATREVIARLGPCPIVEALAAAGVDEIGELLTVHRLAGPGDDGVRHPVEIDLGLAECELPWREVRALPPIADRLARHPAVARLEAAFTLDFRWICVGLGDRDKLNVYYALAEPARDASGDA